MMGTHSPGESAFNPIHWLPGFSFFWTVDLSLYGRSMGFSAAEKNEWSLDEFGRGEPVLDRRRAFEQSIKSQVFAFFFFSKTISAMLF